MSLRDSHCKNLDRLCRICGNLLGKKALAKGKDITWLKSVLFINITKDILPRLLYVIGEMIYSTT